VGSSEGPARLTDARSLTSRCFFATFVTWPVTLAEPGIGGDRMNAAGDPDTEELLDRAGMGDRLARQELLARHRTRLRQMVELRIDRRMAARVDPSDVVQDALADAAGRLSEYLKTRPIPFYPWLRHFAWERLLQLHRFHLRSQRRSVDREQLRILDLPGDSEAILAERLVQSGTNPSDGLLRDELRARVRNALEALPPRDREVLVLRYLEQLSTGEIASVLGIREAAVKARHRRALERLRSELDAENGEASE
jgi:RNA polymerase sigma-70 factor (ECF subfamily)